MLIVAIFFKKCHEKSFTIVNEIGFQFTARRKKSLRKKIIWGNSTVVFQPTLIQNHFFDFDGLFYSF